MRLVLVEDSETYFILGRVGNQILSRVLASFFTIELESLILGESVQSTEEPYWSYGESVFVGTF